VVATQTRRNARLHGPIGQTLTEVAALVDAGKIVPEVSRIIPLSEMKMGHELIETRHTRGKIGVRVAD
jgi:NADPH:quinone reductase-like Zn-dependent oxidoreductase